MRIGVNVLPLRPRVMGGAEIYLRELLEGIRESGQHQLVLVTSAEHGNDGALPEGPGCRHVRIGGPPGLARRLRARLPIPARWRGPLSRLRGGLGQGLGARLRETIRREGVDLWFCPFSELQPRVGSVPTVITVHDLQHEYLPQLFSADELAHRRRFYPESCGGADHVIAVSDFTRRCVLERYGVDPDRVTTVWETAGEDVDWAGGTARVEAVRQRYRLPPTYVFYPANTWPHKNHARLLEALALCRAEGRPDVELVLTGARVDGTGTLESLIASHGLGGAVHVLGYVPRADLPALYAAAAGLVLPSLFEGFGIPLVEAMRAGCPIAAAAGTSIPEIAGDAALLFEPTDVRAIARTLEILVRDPATGRELARRGHARSALFSREAMVRGTLGVFERACARRTEASRPARALLEVEGVHDDGWMGRTAVLSVRGAALATLVVEGELPAVGAVCPQELTVEIDRRPVVTVPLGRDGAFTFTVPLVGDGRDGGWEVALTARRTFQPRRAGISPDARRLSVRLARVRLRAADGGETVTVLGAS